MFSSIHLSIHASLCKSWSLCSPYACGISLSVFGKHVPVLISHNISANQCAAFLIIAHATKRGKAHLRADRCGRAIGGLRGCTSGSLM